MKDVILALNVDIQTINVDSKKVRKQLKNNKWGVNQVPTLLLLHENGEFKVVVQGELDQWFSDLIDNVKGLETQSPKGGSGDVTPLDISEGNNGGTDGTNGGISITTNPGYVSSAIVQKNPNEKNEDAPKISSSIKKENSISPAEMAKQMVQQREHLEEQYSIPPNN